MREICGNCKYNRYSREFGDFYCGNEDSFNYEVQTFYDDTCEDYEEKE
jgi:hypothetical protein